MDLPVGGTTRKMSVTAGKIAIFDAIDRTNGQYLFSRDMGLQTLVKSIDPKTGKKIIDPALEPVANKQVTICPHSGGAKNWLASSYDASTHTLFVPLVESCQDFTWKPNSPEKVAAGILHALRKNCTETVLGWDARWMLRVNRFWPRLVDALLARQIRRLYATA